MGKIKFYKSKKINQVVIFFVIAISSTSSFAAFTKNEFWSISDDQLCDSFNYVTYSKQAVGVLSLNQSLKITVPVPENAIVAFFNAQSHASSPSMDFSKTDYTSLCFNRDVTQCTAEQIPIATNGTGDTLAALAGSFTQKQFPIDETVKNVFVYQTNTGDNNGESSMFAASVSFELPREECERRANPNLSAEPKSEPKSESEPKPEPVITHTISGDVNAYIESNFDDLLSAFKAKITVEDGHIEYDEALKDLLRKLNTDVQGIYDDNIYSYGQSFPPVILTPEFNLHLNQIYYEGDVYASDLVALKNKDIRAIFGESAVSDNDDIFTHNNKYFFSMDVSDDVTYIVLDGINEDKDEDGISILDGDCNDNDDSVYPGADGDDKNCSLEMNESE